MKLGPEQNVQMPMKTVISLIIMVSLGTMGYFQIQEKLNQHDTLLQMHTKTWIKIQNLESNTPGVSWASHQENLSFSC